MSRQAAYGWRQVARLEAAMVDILEKTRIFRNVPDVGLMRDDPLAYLEYDHKAQRALADLLETVADSLPDKVNQASASLAASLLRDSQQRRSALEEEGLFPLIERRAADGAPLRRAILLARRDYRDCAGRAIELAEELDSLAETGQAANAEALGFMLRAFFEGLRRHLDWVDVTILSQVREALSAEDVAELGAQFVSMRSAAQLWDWAGLALVRPSCA
jgi:hemerythrin-like domain-containing protein